MLLQGSDVTAKFEANKQAVLDILAHSFEDGLGHAGPQIRKTATGVVNRLRSFLEEEVRPGIRGMIQYFFLHAWW